MKKIKFWLMAMLAIVATVSFTACGDDDDGPDVIDSPIVGTWEDSCRDYEKIVTFKSNGTYEWSLTEYDSFGTESFYESGTYSISGNYVTIKCNKIHGESEDGPIVDSEGAVSDYVGQISRYGFYITGNTLGIDFDNDGYYYNYTKK